MEDRAKLVELITSQQVVNAEFYNSLRVHTPLLSKLMMDKFKHFLNDEYWTDLERQTMLMKFLEDQSDIEVIKEILEYTQGCDRKDDYTKIIMEWTFHNSEKIIKSNLAKVDGSALCGKKQKTNKLSTPSDLTETVMEGLIALTAELLGEDLDDGNEKD